MAMHSESHNFNILMRDMLYFGHQVQNMFTCEKETGVWKNECM